MRRDATRRDEIRRQERHGKEGGGTEKSSKTIASVVFHDSGNPGKAKQSKDGMIPAHLCGAWSVIVHLFIVSGCANGWMGRWANGWTEEGPCTQRQRFFIV